MAAARALAGLSGGEMAERLGVSRNMIYRWEGGHDEPRRMVTMAYAYVCGVDHEEWFVEGSTDLPTGREVGHLTSCQDSGQFAA